MAFFKEKYQHLFKKLSFFFLKKKNKTLKKKFFICTFVFLFNYTLYYFKIKKMVYIRMLNVTISEWRSIAKGSNIDHYRIMFKNNSKIYLLNQKVKILIPIPRSKKPIPLQGPILSRRTRNLASWKILQT